MCAYLHLTEGEQVMPECLWDAYKIPQKLHSDDLISSFLAVRLYAQSAQRPNLPLLTLSVV